MNRDANHARLTYLCDGLRASALGSDDRICAAVFMESRSLSCQYDARSFLTWERVIAAVRDDRVIGFCTFTEKYELPE